MNVELQFYTAVHVRFITIFIVSPTTVIANIYYWIILNVATQCESIHITLDSDSDSSEGGDPPLPKSRGATVKSEKGMHTKKNLKGTYIIVRN